MNYLKGVFFANTVFVHKMNPTSHYQYYISTENQWKSNFSYKLIEDISFTHVLCYVYYVTRYPTLSYLERDVVQS